MAIIKTNARSASALDATILSGNLPSISGASLTGLTDNGKILKVTYASPSNYSTTLGYSDTSLTPCASIAVTTVGLNSHFLIKWSAVHGRNGNGRSQFLMAKAYTAGQNNYANSNYLFYDHYGCYFDNANNLKTTSSYSYYDSGSTLAIGATQTYYIFLGQIGSGTSDEANNQRLQVMEIAQ